MARPGRLVGIARGTKRGGGCKPRRGGAFEGRGPSGRREASSRLAGEMGKVEDAVSGTGGRAQPGWVWREAFRTWSGLQSLVMSDTTHSSVLWWVTASAPLGRFDIKTIP